MADTITLKAESRQEAGTGASRRLRRAGKLPAVVDLLSGDKAMIQMKQHDFELMLKRHHSESLIVDIVLGDGDPVKALVTDVQHDGLSGDVLHADMREISMSEKLTITVTVDLVGEPIGVTRDGGVLEQMTHAMEVECRADELVESINVDISNLNLGDSLRVADLALSAALTVLTPEDTVVASVLAPRLEEEKAPGDEEGNEAEKRKEEGEQSEKVD